MASWEALGIKKITEVVAFVMSHHKEGEPVTLAADSPLKQGTAPAAPSAAPVAPKS
jgi:hypothetical protein